MTDAEEIIDRCSFKLRLWRDVYDKLGIEFEYRRPTELEMYQWELIKIAEQYKK